LGRLIYHRNQVLEIDDRALAHVEAVASNKLRRGEPFMLTVTRGTVDGGGRVTIWVNPGSNLVYRYRRDRPLINREWLEILMRSANSPPGLIVTPEPEGEDPGKTAA
jgi:hypothetical protein